MNNLNIHNRRSVRLQGYDYAQAGLYFITICCHNRECLFGNITNGEITLNETGNITHKCWIEIPKHYPNAVLHEYILMPNHVHGIVELVGDNNVGAENFLPLENDTGISVGVANFQSRHAFQKMIPRSIGSIVKGFKIGVTKWCRKNTEIETVWQRNYHEHIIRNERAYQTISKYIINNPRNWKKRKFYNQ